MDKFDVAVIGGGPGGYVAAIRAAKSGFSVALIEARELGGTCLNRGCIPSKTMLKHAELIDQMKKAKSYGITVNDISYSLPEMVQRKNKIVNQLRNGINGLLKQNNITFFHGYGVVQADKTIQIQLANETNYSIQSNHIILATGSKPFVPQIEGVNEVNFDTSDTIFDLKEIPSSLVIVGGGVIGLEIACVFHSLGSKVEIVEMAERILPSEDEAAATFLAEQLKQKGILLHTGTKIIGLKKAKKTTVEIETKGERIQLQTEQLLISAGRTPNLSGTEELPLQFTNGFIQVDQHMQTSIPGIYAIGDVIGGYQLAHVASHEGLQAVKHILGEKSASKIAVPRCVYTFPEIASVGMTEEQAKEAGYQVRIKKVDLTGNGKAIASGENQGFMKLIADKQYGEILGVVMVGAHVTEMISQATAFIHLEATVEEIETMIFPHPTASESLFETAAAWLGKGIHYN
ncbi:dihydrolipoyl dehydrogenase [Virgibacillus pantothenticus]|uniref:dihydrolipoyl dehydrogenase n=1 Tax=Virgibacillus pantothenticus TaxID=1473 RepID=UPI0009861F7A|nr:dihydrolipoyl dehydrogenase [Virgibacillus pantothenticus]